MELIPRRDGPRIDLRLRVRYSASNAHGEGEASDVSPHGLRLESDLPLAMGTRLKLMVDAGDGPPAEVTAQVMWCREHQSPTGKTVHDVGLHLENTWMTPAMGKLGAALTRLFALQAREMSPGYTQAPGGLDDGAGLRLVDLRVGLMQFHCDEPLRERLASGSDVLVDLHVEGARHSVSGTVAWVSDQTAAAPGVRFQDAFGIDVRSANAQHKELLERLRLGQSQLERFVVRR